MIELITELIVSANIHASYNNISERRDDGTHFISEDLPPIPTSVDHQYPKNPCHCKIAETVKKNNDNIFRLVGDGGLYNQSISCFVSCCETDDMNVPVRYIRCEHADEDIVNHEEEFEPFSYVCKVEAINHEDYSNKSISNNNYVEKKEIC